MAKKILSAMLAALVGMLAVLMLISIASAGYTFGQYLAQSKKESATQAAPKPGT